MRIKGRRVTEYGSLPGNISGFCCLIPEGLPRAGFLATGRRALGTRATARYAGVMAARRPYPSDLSDARWALAGPTLTAWRQREHRAGLGIGRPPRHDLRSILDAILYGRPHRHPPALPPARVPALGDGVLLLRPLAERRRVRAAQRPVTAVSPGRRGP